MAAVMLEAGGSVGRMELPDVVHTASGVSKSAVN